MPKYTPVQSYSNGQLIRSTDWNIHFGSIGNLQWGYDELQNVSGGRFVMLKNAINPAIVNQNVIYQFVNFQEAYGDLDLCNMLTGTIQVPMHAGYVFISACISHNVTGIVNTNVPAYTLSIIDVENSFFVNPNNFTVAAEMYTTTAFTNKGGAVITPNSIAPLIPSLSISAIIPIYNGASRFRLGIYRSDNSIAAQQVQVTHFSMIPLADTSGLVNFINNVEQVIE